jgi:hypothetical protein
VILYRYDNDIIFEEKRTGDKMPVDPAAIILEKDSKNNKNHLFSRKLLVISQRNS